jgi:SAM-dependent methyltransferase
MNPRWYVGFFRAPLVREFWRHSLGPEHTRAEVDFLERLLGRRGRLLDVPCGQARHAIALARRGAHVTGVDVAAEFLDEARANAAAARVRVDLVRADMHDLAFRAAAFDGAYCLGNSFGYLDLAGTTRFAAALAHALRPGGRLVVETGMAAESILHRVAAQDAFDAGGIRLEVENRYLADRRCLETRGTFVRGAVRETRTWWHFVFTIDEIRAVFASAGLAVTGIYGDLGGRAFVPGDSRLLALAERTP